MALELIRRLLDGCTHAGAVMPWGTPGPIRLPENPGERARLIQGHISGGPATVTYCPAGKPEQSIEVNPCVLSALCPAADGLARWVAVDIDGSNHGVKGLADAGRVMRCLTERADHCGLLPGLVVNRSKSGKGYHVWLILPAPTPLGDAVAGLSAWAAASWWVAASDARDWGLWHAFTTMAGKLALPGEPGAVELIPRGDNRPERGWPLTLPCAGGRGIVDPFDPLARTSGKGPDIAPAGRLPDEPSYCPAGAWAALLRGAKVELNRYKVARLHARPVSNRPRRPDHGDPMQRIDPRTRQFIEGKVSPGGRNAAAYAATCNMLGCGLDPADVETLIFNGASKCGLPEREARAAIASARKAVLR